VFPTSEFNVYSIRAASFLILKSISMKKATPVSLKIEVEFVGATSP